MSKLVIDIETVGKDLKDLDSISQEYFKHWAEANANGNQEKINLEL